MDDHQRLGSLVADDRESEGSIDVCEACRGYLKVFSVLQPRAAREVMLRDLDSVLLDLAATARGYRPQPRTGCSPSLTVSPRAARGLAI